MDDTVTKIKEYLKIINKNTEQIELKNKGLIDFCINEVLDRVQLYLNSEAIPKKLERILANIVNNGLKKSLKDIEISKEDITIIDKDIKTISDNGQSITYTDKVTQYFSSVNDEELFTGFSELLKRYRRVKVVYPQNNE